MPESPTAVEEVTPISADADVVAESSTAEDVAKPQGSENKSMLDAVKAALAGPDKSPESETQVPNADSKAKPEGEADPIHGDLTEEEVKQLSRKAQRRFRELSTGNKDFEVKLKELAPKAENFDRITQLMQHNRLSPEDVDTGFKIMGLMKLSPEKALEELAPIVKNLLKAVGHELPDDLAKEVQAGAISEERARELSQARSRADRLSGQSEQEAEQRAAEEEDRQHKATVKTAVDTAEAWHKEKAATDPDWHLKQNRVVELVKLHVLETGKFPQSEKDARALFDEKLKSVETELKRFLPKKQEVKQVDGGASSRSKPEPKSMLDVINMAVGS